MFFDGVAMYAYINNNTNIITNAIYLKSINKAQMQSLYCYI